MSDSIKKDEAVRRIGPGLLIYGDCLDVMSNIPDNSVDLVLSDPPYGWVVQQIINGMSLFHLNLYGKILKGF